MRKILILSVILSVAVYFAGKLKSPSGATSNYVDSSLYMGRCSLLTKNFDLVYQFPGSYCSVVPHVGVAVRSDNGLVLVGPENEIIFKIDEIFHHGVYFDKKERILFVLDAKDELTEDGVYAVMSGVRAYNLSGDEVLKIDGHVIVNYLREQGEKIVPYDRRLESAAKIGVDWMAESRLKSRRYLTFFNNIHVLDHDITGTEYKEGDFLVNILNPTGHVLIDRKTLKPKSWFPYYGREINGQESHHPIVVGNELFVFLNRVEVANAENPEAQVASYNLQSGKLNWLWPRDHLDENDHFKIFSPSHGGITYLGRDRFLVYTMYDKFVLLFDSKNFTYKFLLQSYNPVISHLRDGRELVDLHPVPLSEIDNFKFLNLDIFSNESIPKDYFFGGLSNNNQ